MHPIAERLLGGERVCPSEVNVHNATRLMGWVRDVDSHHTKEGCKDKDCVHAPGDMTVDWAAALVAEAAVICTCGGHGVNDPRAAAEVIAGFRSRWSTSTEGGPS